MSDELNASTARQSARADVRSQLRTMPGWQKLVLSLGVLLAAAGAAGWVVGKVGAASERSASTPVQRSDDPAPPPGSSQLLSRSGEPARADSDSAAAAAEPQPLALRISPAMMRIGASLLVGFIVGFLFRAFVKMMLLVTLVIGGIVFALSWFNVLNVDLTAAHESYDSARAWLGDQALRLKDLILTHLPSSVSGALGAFMGFRRS